jgi:hypothetical protein
MQDSRAAEETELIGVTFSRNGFFVLENEANLVHGF